MFPSLLRQLLKLKPGSLPELKFITTSCRLEHWRDGWVSGEPSTQGSVTV